MLEKYQQEFADFLVKSNALKFGDFTLKSGRKAPYFINTGSFDSGASLAKLGSFYAAHLQSLNVECDTIFGPAYKGIPLCVSTASALALNYNREVGVTFDRKEVKDHGDGGLLVGRKIKDGDKVVIVDDVITAGTTFRQMVPMLKEIANVDITAVIVAVDRCEKGTGELSAVQELQKDLGLNFHPILNIHQLVEYLSADNTSGLRLSEEQLGKIKEYLSVYGA